MINTEAIRKKGLRFTLDHTPLRTSHIMSLIERLPLSRQFRWFAENECSSELGEDAPLYRRFALEVAEDDDLLDLAGSADSFPIPNLFFAAVKYELQGATDHPLTAYYPMLVEDPKAPDEDADAAFRQFCLEHQDGIRERLRNGTTQTNVVRRSAALYPAFARIAEATNDRPLATVDIGSSGGLNLYWDEYVYDYGDGNRYGSSEAQTSLQCTVRGDTNPPMPATPPEVGSRYGIDLNPLDPADEHDGRWLRAFVWPDHTGRHESFESALSHVAERNPEVLEGDATERLPTVAERVPDEETLVVVATQTAYQLSSRQQRRFEAALASISDRRPVYVLTGGYSIVEDKPVLHLDVYEDGDKERTQLLAYGAFGSWIEWLDDGSVR